MAWLYLNEGLPASLAPGDRAWIDGPEAHHAAVVSRVRHGERLRIADGRGTCAEGAVATVARDRVEIEVESVTHETAPAVDLWLVQALAKGDRGELAIQAATELGVSRVVPWQAARSVARWTGDKAAKGAARWAATVREAAKQSLRARVPVVEPLADLAAVSALAAAPGVVVVLDPGADAALPALCLPEGPLARARRAVIVVGPEGGIDTHELATLEAAGAVRARLGSTVLRTSTAGPAAIAVVQAMLGEWAAPATAADHGQHGAD